MILAWVFWPVIMLFYLSGLALRRMLRRWYLPVEAGAATLVISLAVLYITPYTEPNSVIMDDPRLILDFLVRSWQRIQILLIPRLLPDGWTRYESYPGHWPSHEYLLHAYLHVASALGLTAVVAVLAVMFARAMLQTIGTLFFFAPGDDLPSW